MPLPVKCRPAVAASLVVLLCGATAPAWADGDTFFKSTEIPGNPIYVVFGNVKDDQGNYLGRATVRIAVAQHMLSFISTTDVLGRFRTPDVGRVIRELGYEIDPALISVSAEYPGFHISHRIYHGKYRQNRGAVEIDFIMARNGQ